MLTLHPFPFMSEVQAVLHEAICLSTQCIDGYAACLSRAIVLGNKKLKTSGVDTSYCCFMANIKILKFLPGFMPSIFYIYEIVTTINACCTIGYSCKQEKLSYYMKIQLYFQTLDACMQWLYISTRNSWFVFKCNLRSDLLS